MEKRSIIDVIVSIDNLDIFSGEGDEKEGGKEEEGKEAVEADWMDGLTAVNKALLRYGSFSIRIERKRDTVVLSRYCSIMSYGIVDWEI